jgi:hypothetical protein
MYFSLRKQYITGIIMSIRSHTIGTSEIFVGKFQADVTLNNGLLNFHIRTVQLLDIIKVFYSPPDAQVNCLKNNSDQCTTYTLTRT